MNFIQKNRRVSSVIIMLSIVVFSVVSSYCYHRLFGNCPFRFFGGINISRILIFMTVFSVFGAILLYGFNQTVDFILYHRYAFSAAVVVFGMLLNINGSSASAWGAYVAEIPDGTEGIVLGIPRMIRSDEWAVFTPMILSQGSGENSYAQYSELIRACSTNISMHYGLPYWGILTLFRPFLLGYLFFGASYGLSFYWCARAVLLFLVSYEFGLLITEKKRYLSLIYAMIMLLSPQIQWWFSINGLVEILMSAMLSILLLNCMMHRVKWWKRLLCALGVFYCAGCFIMAIYPSWQIPVAYLIIALIIWIFYRNRKDYYIALPGKKSKQNPSTSGRVGQDRDNSSDYIEQKRDKSSDSAGQDKKNPAIRIGAWEIVLILGFAAIFALILGTAFYRSSDVIEAVRNTVYPGTRLESGGGRLINWFGGWVSIFFPFNQNQIPANVCEAAVMFDLFPAGVVLAVTVMIHEKKKDTLLLLLLLVNLFFAIWCIFGFPIWLAKLTFLSQSQANRSYLVVGLSNTLLLVRALAIRERVMGRRISAVVSIICALVAVLGTRYFFREYVNVIYLIAIFLFASAVYYMLYRYPCPVSRFTLVPVLGIVLGIAGCLVNPIQRGLGILENSELADAVKETEATEPGTWIFEGDTCWPMSNYLLAQGVPVINCVNTYPNLSLWKKIDPKGEFEEVYNRYASSVTIYITADEYRPRFHLIGPDQFAVNLKPDELSLLGIDYVVTTVKLSETGSDGALTAEPLRTAGRYYIYQVESGSR